MHLFISCCLGKDSRLPQEPSLRMKGEGGANKADIHATGSEGCTPAKEYGSQGVQHAPAPHWGR